MAEETGWLARFNCGMHEVNVTARQGLVRVGESLPEAPSLPDSVREGASHLITTWVANPRQALSLTIAGRPGNARVALDRSWAKIGQGGGGLRDRAAETSMPRPPAADLGLALCALGVLEGPYLVLPFVGGRTLREGRTDLVVANAGIYTALIPVIGTAPPRELLLALQLLGNVPIWLLADRMGRVQGESLVPLDMKVIRAICLASRCRACEALRAP